MAGRPITEHDLIRPHGLQAEIAVKGGYSHHFGRAVARALGHMVDDLLRQIAINRLGLLENHDQTGGILLILAQYAFHQG